MESTGKYWIPIFNVLEEHVHVIVANPKYVRAIKGQKTDDKDAMWIADLSSLTLFPPVTSPLRKSASCVNYSDTVPNLSMNALLKKCAC